MLFAVGLEKRFGPRGIHAFALHPGGIETNLGRHMSEEDRAGLMARIKKLIDSTEGPAEGWKTIPQGAATTCWVATAQELEGRGGLYAENCHIADTDDSNPVGGVRSYALDKGNADRLWALSEQLVSEKFEA